MTSVSNEQNAIIRTERGLPIAGTRITLYQFMDYICAGCSPKYFRHHFPQIADKHFDAAMSYIEANRAEVEAEYQVILKEAEEIRQYWEEQNRERVTQIAATPRKPGHEAAWAKLQAQKAKLQSKT